MTQRTVMRLCAVVAAVFSFAGIAFAQSTYDVDLTSSSATVKSFTDALTSQTGTVFSYEASVASKQLGSVSIREKGTTVAAILDKVLVPKGVTYKVVGNTYVLSAVPESKGATNSITVKGVVVDQNGEPLPGAGVWIKGSTTGTVTDGAGKYEIRALANQTLVFSFIGYVSEEVAIAGQTKIDVVLSDDSTVLDDVVVVGYGTQSRKTLTTSVSKIDGDKLMDAPVANVGEALKGKVSGLRVMTSNSLSGEAPRFMVRGGSSINMGNDPIYIVDGALRDDLNGINSNDIESMEVLKDAASAAIYGARASNGVILVTTRKGSVSKGAQIVFETQTGFTQPERYWDLMNSREQLALVRPEIARVYKNTTGTTAAAMWLNGGNVAMGTGNTSENNYFTTQYLDYGAKVPDGYQWMTDPVNPNKVIIFTDYDSQRDWLKTAFWHKEYVGINDGNDRIRYSASVSYLGDDGVIAMNDYNVITMHGSATVKISKKLEATTTFDMSRQNSSKFTDNYFNAYGRGIMLAPTIRGYNSEGHFVQGAANANHEIAAYYENFYERETDTNRSSSNTSLKWTIADGLKLVGQYNFYETNYRGSYYARGSFNGQNAIISTTRSTTETRTQTIRDTFSTYLAFDKSYNNTHHVQATAGYEFMNQRYTYLTANSTGSVSDDVPILDSGLNFTASNKDESQALMSAFGRAQYDYKHKYIVSATFRCDGSSKFAAGNRWGFFPAGSFAWVVSEEPFVVKMMDKLQMNTLKFRASYGQTGNNGIGLYDTYGAYATDKYDGHTTYLPSAMQNADMKWETTTQLDLGLDMGFFNDRLRFVIDYYNKVTDNMIFSITLPDTSPISSVKANVGSARFYGFEMEIGAEPVRTKDFSWNIGLTYSYNQNRVLSLPDEYAYDEVDVYGVPTGRTAYRIGGYKMTETGYRFGGTAVGEPLGRIYGYSIDHIVESASEADAALYDASGKGHRVSDGLSIVGRKDIGDYVFKNRIGSARDEHGNEIINSEDMFYLGNVTPHSTGGINNTLRFKGLTFSFYFDFAVGHSIYNYMKSRMLQNTIAYSNSAVATYAYDCWQYPGDSNAKYARFFPNDGDYGNANWGRASEFNVEKASYLCLRDVSLSYDLPENWLKSFMIKKINIGVSGNTLRYFSGVTGAINPETGIGASSGSGMYTSVSTADGSGNIFPGMRRILFNLKFTF